jgi:hypothetical protein
MPLQSHRAIEEAVNELKKKIGGVEMNVKFEECCSLK